MSFPTEKFIWSEKAYSLRQFENCFRATLPRFVQIVDGYLWRDEETQCFASGEVYYIPVIGHQSRVLVKDRKCRLLSIPRDFAQLFCLSDDQGNASGRPRTLADIVRDFPLWGQKKYVVFSDNKTLSFIAEACDFRQPVPARLEDAMEIINVYSERFLVAHGVVYDELVNRPAAIPITLPVTLTVAQGVGGTSMESLSTLIQRASNAVKRVSKGVSAESILQKNIMVFSDEFVDEDGYSLVKPTSFLRVSETPSLSDADDSLFPLATARAQSQGARTEDSRRLSSLRNEPIPEEGQFSPGSSLSPLESVSSPDSVFLPSGPSRSFTMLPEMTAAPPLVPRRRPMQLSSSSTTASSPDSPMTFARNHSRFFTLGGRASQTMAREQRYVPSPTLRITRTEDEDNRYACALDPTLLAPPRPAPRAMGFGREAFSDSELLEDSPRSSRRSQAVSESSLAPENVHKKKKKKSKRGLKALFRFLSKRLGKKRSRKPAVGESDAESIASEPDIGSSPPAGNCPLYQNMSALELGESNTVTVSVYQRYQSEGEAARPTYAAVPGGSIRGCKLPAAPRARLPRPDSNPYDFIPDGQFDLPPAPLSPLVEKSEDDASGAEPAAQQTTTAEGGKREAGDGDEDWSLFNVFKNSLPRYRAPTPHGAPWRKKNVDSYMTPRSFIDNDNDDDDSSSTSSSSGYAEIDPLLISPGCSPDVSDGPPVPCARPNQEYSYVDARNVPLSPKGRHRPRSGQGVVAKVQVDKYILEGMMEVTQELSKKIHLRNASLKCIGNGKKSVGAPRKSRESSGDDELMRKLKARKLKNGEEDNSGRSSPNPLIDVKPEAAACPDTREKSSELVDTAGECLPPGPSCSRPSSVISEVSTTSSTWYPPAKKWQCHLPGGYSVDRKDSMSSIASTVSNASTIRLIDDTDTASETESEGDVTGGINMAAHWKRGLPQTGPSRKPFTACREVPAVPSVRPQLRSQSESDRGGSTLRRGRRVGATLDRAFGSPPALPPKMPRGRTSSRQRLMTLR